MTIIQQSKTIQKVVLTKDILTIFTAQYQTRILMVHVVNKGQLNRHISFYTEKNELISEHFLSAYGSLAFNFSDNQYIMGEGIKAKQDDGNDVEVSIDLMETIIV